MDQAWWVRVEYGGLGEPPSPTGAFRPGRDGLDPHATRRFICKSCGVDLPVRDDRLAPIVARHGAAVLALDELWTKLSKQ